MRTMISGSVALAGFLALAGSPVFAQRFPERFRAVPNEAEILAAVQGSDINGEKNALLLKAADLPAHALRDSTVTAIGAEVIKAWRQIQAQFDADPGSRHEGDAEGEYLSALIGILKHQKNPAGIDGLVTVVPYFASNGDIAEFGDKAVHALVRRARQPESAGEVGHINGAMDVLEQMLEQPAIRTTLSAGSRLSIRQVAAELLKDLGRPETAGSTLAHASYLAVATGDPQLRKQVTDLVGNDIELRRRGVVDAEKQQWFKKVVGEALVKKFQD